MKDQYQKETDMKYTKLGKSDLTVSRICMGCMGLGAAGKGQHIKVLR